MIMSGTHGNIAASRAFVNINRRARGDAIETYKTLQGINKVHLENWFTVVGEEARPTRANSEVLGEGEVRRLQVLEVERAECPVLEWRGQCSS